MYLRYFFIVLTTVLGLLTQPVAIAKENGDQKNTSFPVGCVNTGHHFELYNVILTPSAERSTQTVYFIHNISTQPVYLLESQKSDNPYIMYINGRVDPALWSVLAVTEKQIKFICTHYDTHKKMHEVIKCQDVLAICEFKKALFGPNHRGTYWMTINKSQKAAVNMARNYGVWLNAIHHEEDIGGL